MKSSNVGSNWFAGFSLEADCEKLIKKGKINEVKFLFSTILSEAPINDDTATTFVDIIFRSIPLSNKELADELIERLIRKYDIVDVNLIKTTDVSMYNSLDVSGGILTVETGSEDIIQKVQWFKNKVKQ